MEQGSTGGIRRDGLEEREGLDDVRNGASDRFQLDVEQRATINQRELDVHVEGLEEHEANHVRHRGEMQAGVQHQVYFADGLENEIVIERSGQDSLPIRFALQQLANRLQIIHAQRKQVGEEHELRVRKALLQPIHEMSHQRNVERRQRNPCDLLLQIRSLRVGECTQHRNQRLD